MFTAYHKEITVYCYFFMVLLRVFCWALVIIKRVSHVKMSQLHMLTLRWIFFPGEKRKRRIKIRGQLKIIK